MLVLSLWFRSFEKLYCSILKLKEKDIVTVSDSLRDQLRSENTKERHHNDRTNTILTKELRFAANSLKANYDIVIRKADKVNIYVIMNKDEYKRKLDEILSDHRKFKKIKKNPIPTLKIAANKLINRANFRQKEKIFSPIICEYKPGTCMGMLRPTRMETH